MRSVRFGERGVLSSVSRPAAGNGSLHGAPVFALCSTTGPRRLWRRTLSPEVLRMAFVSRVDDLARWFHHFAATGQRGRVLETCRH